MRLKCQPGQCFWASARAKVSSDRPLNSASKLTHVGLSPGLSGDFRDDLNPCECFKWRTSESMPRGKPQPLYNLISEVTLHHLCLILFVGSTSTPTHTRTWINRKQVSLRSIELAGPRWWCQFLDLGGDYVIALWLFIGLYVFCTLFYKMLSFTKNFLIKNKVIFSEMTDIMWRSFRIYLKNLFMRFSSMGRKWIMGKYE